MENMKEVLKNLELEQQILLADIPAIDLYMDQIIGLFEQKFSSSRRNEDEKVLTKTMINNYAKGKLFFPIKNKKYSPQHLILISLIYQLKGALSITDIKGTLELVNKKAADDGFDLEQFYSGFLHLAGKNTNSFMSDLDTKINDVKEEIQSLEDEDSSELEKVLLIASLAHTSNLYRRVAEKLVDELKK